MRLKSLALTAFALPLSVAAGARDACPSNIRGQTIHWIVAVCEARAETDDFESPAVQDCVAAMDAKYKIQSSTAQNCRLNALYKREWCASIPDSGGQRSASKCFKSSRTLPRVVLNGGVGG